MDERRPGEAAAGVRHGGAAQGPREAGVAVWGGWECHSQNMMAENVFHLAELTVGVTEDRQHTTWIVVGFKLRQFESG